MDVVVSRMQMPMEDTSGELATASRVNRECGVGWLVSTRWPQTRRRAGFGPLGARLDLKRPSGGFELHGDPALAQGGQAAVMMDAAGALFGVH